MGIDVATWQARIGLSYSRQSRYACCPLSVQYVEGGKMGSGGGHEQHTSSAPGLHGGRLPVTDALGYTFRSRPIGRCGCGKVRRPKLRSGSVPSTEVRGMPDTGIIGVCLLLEVCAVVLLLLLMAGDVERNPGPTGKEGMFQGLSPTCSL